MARIWLALASLAFGFFTLGGCRSAPQREEQPPTARTTISTAESSRLTSTSSDDGCGLDNFPVSKPNKEILAAAPRDMGQPPNQNMVAKVAIDTGGKVTHLRVLRLAWPKLANSYAINEQALESIKRWHQTPTVVSGKPVAVCSDVLASRLTCNEFRTSFQVTGNPNLPGTGHIPREGLDKMNKWLRLPLLS